MSLLAQHGAMLVSGATSWNPSALSPSIWLDDSTNVTDVSGTASQWNDKSGNSFHFVQGTSGRRPQIMHSALNGRRVLRFDGVQNAGGDKMLGPSGTQELMNNVGAAWVFSVLNKRNTDAGSQYRALLTGLGNDADWRFGAWLGAPGYLNRTALAVRRVNANAVVFGHGTNVISGSWRAILWTQDYTNAASSIVIDGISEFSGSLGTTGNTEASNSSSPLVLAGNAGDTMCADIDVACMLFGAGSTLPSSGEFANLFAWAAARYDL